MWREYLRKLNKSVDQASMRARRWERSGGKSGCAWQDVEAGCAEEDVRGWEVGAEW